MAEEKVTRSKGVVTKFNDQKGYGFIQPDEGGEDLFVHQTAIKSDGYRTLREGQVVEFTIILDGDKTKAADVTAPGGGPVDSTSRRGNNSNSRGVVMGSVIGEMMAMGMVIGVAEAAAEGVSVLIVESMVIWRGIATTAAVEAEAEVEMVEDATTVEVMGIWLGSVLVVPEAVAEVGLVLPVGSQDTWRETVCVAVAAAAVATVVAVVVLEGLVAAVVGESVSTVGSLDTLPGNAKKRLVNNLMRRLS
ncbi:UNVERIFIED_CONTAM: Glycine-rich protein 2 [Sesamum latifolium]|uniref:Glycine-rich protein 2 n=1 Tax=Sesamum latifolium TaxID=2727402 RepID=A0AAW2X6K8_9LAMI